MPRILMFSKVVLGWRINWGMLQAPSKGGELQHHSKGRREGAISATQQEKGRSHALSRFGAPAGGYVRYVQLESTVR